MRKILKSITPNFILFLFRSYSEYKTKEASVKKYADLSVGKNVFIEGECRFETGVVLGNDTHLNNVSVGKNTSFSGQNSARNAVIGKFCSIAPRVKINLGSHPSNMVSTHASLFSRGYKGTKYVGDQGVDFEQFPPVSIGNDVWIGENAMIKEGVKIGDGAIIGAGAVVTKDVEPYAIVGGVPAKLIKYRFSPAQIKFLEGFKWWDRSDEWLKDNAKLFADIEGFISAWR